MNTKLAVAGGCGRFVPRRGSPPTSLFAATPLAAQGPPLPPVPRSVAVETEKPSAHPLADRFQAVIKQVEPGGRRGRRGEAAEQRPDRQGEGRRGIGLRRAGEVSRRRRAWSSITNNHVVGAAEPAKVYVTLSDGRILQPSRIWADPESDIALLHLDDETLPTVELGDSDRVRRGQWVLAFGSPFGLNQTVTHGIISATERGQINLGSTIRIKEFLQTDAAINPGSSGGPLVDLDGRVVGINTAIASKSGDNSGVSFSIPGEPGEADRGAAHRERERDARLPRRAAGEHARAGGGLRLGLSRVSGALVEIVHPERRRTPPGSGRGRDPEARGRRRSATRTT